MRKGILIPMLAAAWLTAQAEDPSPAPTPTASATSSPTATASATPATPTPSPTPHPEEIINGMNGAQIEKAISAIKANYFDPNTTGEEEMKRAMFEGLLVRIGPGAELLTEIPKTENAKKIPFLAEILDSRVGYLRLGAINAESLAQMDASLKKFEQQPLKAVVIDLRGCPPSFDYEMAANFARRFCKKGKMLFSLQKPSAKQERIFTSDQEPVFSGIVIVLTDRDNMGAAEAIAGGLRVSAEAMVVGEQTSGGAVEFTDVNLGDNKTLRIANAKVALPAGKSIYPDGVVPDITVWMDPEEQEEIFRLSSEKGVSQFVFEKERARMNEAALVAKTNPEIESSEESRRGEKEILHDLALQRAVDLVTTIDFYKKAQK